MHKKCSDNPKEDRSGKTERKNSRKKKLKHKTKIKHINNYIKYTFIKKPIKKKVCNNGLKNYMLYVRNLL